MEAVEGDEDLLVCFDPCDLGLDADERQATLIGETYGGEPNEGTAR